MVREMWIHSLKSRSSGMWRRVVLW